MFTRNDGSQMMYTKSNVKNLFKITSSVGYTAHMAP